MYILALPEPKHTEIGKGIPETDVLEEEVKPKAAELADAPKPPPKKPKQPVRITIPALNPVCHFISQLSGRSDLHLYITLVQRKTFEKDIFFINTMELSDDVEALQLISYIYIYMICI